MKTKHNRYQDYVIKNGKLIADFETMYQDFDDPWEQTTREEWASEKAIAINLIQKSQCKKVIELGCGLGHYTKKISDLGVETLGIDISKTAIQKAKTTYPKCNFAVGDILDFELIKQFKPDIIIMAEITWYILDKLDSFIEFIKNEMPNVKIIHLLTTYPDGTQNYGKDKFTNLSEIMNYFDSEYIEWGEITYPAMDGCKRTYFFGQFKK